MSILKFRNTRIAQMNVATQESGSVVRLHLRSDISKPLATKMGWEVMPDESSILRGIDSAKLGGEVNAETVKFIPGGDLKNQAIDFAGVAARDFRVVTKGGGDGEDDPPLTTELRFILLVDPTAAPKVLKYVMSVGDAGARMEVKIAKEQQMKLGEDFEAEEEEEAEEQAEEAEDDGPPLASVREMKKR